jgi:uncharacterized protein involved in exopolysaccharide biosynthesis
VNQQADSVDLADVARTIRRRWPELVLSTVTGGLIALAIITFAPRQFQGTTSVVVKASPTGAGSLLARFGMSGGSDDDAIGGLAGGLLPGMKTPLETEIQILSSRAVAAAAVDSLRLQVRHRGRSAMPAMAIVSSARLPGSFKRTKYDFRRTGDGRYAVSGRGVRTVAAAGAPIDLPVGSITLRADTTLPDAFTLQLLDREDAVTRLEKRSTVKKQGGEVVKIAYRGDDSLTAAKVPNLLVDVYLARRKTVDRGVNLHRVDFLVAQIDTIEEELSRAETALRRHQEASGVIEPTVMAKLQLEQAGELRRELGLVEVENAAIDQMLAQVARGGMTVRQIAAYPSFLKSPGINDLLRQMAELESRRFELLERRVEGDPEVVALTGAIDNIEAQLVPLASAYSTGLARQRQDIRRQLETMNVVLGAFPGAAQSSIRLQRDVMRLGQIHAALQAQLVEARLAAIGEGGDVRQLDQAIAPKKVAFPEPWSTAGVGLGSGFLLGLVLALVSGSMGRYVRDPYEIEKATGVPALQFDAATPLLVSGRPLSNVVLLIPVDPAADTTPVAQRLAQTALSRSVQPTILDLTGDFAVRTEGGIGATIERLESEYGLVIVQLPGITADATAGALRESRPVLLVTPSGRVDRARLTSAVQTLRRLEVPCAGVVMTPPTVRDALVAS